MKKLLILICFTLLSLSLFSCKSKDQYHVFDLYNNFPDKLDYYILDNYVNYENAVDAESYKEKETYVKHMFSTIEQYMSFEENDSLDIRYVEAGIYYHVYKENEIKVYTKIPVGEKIDDFTPSEYFFNGLENLLNVDTIKNKLKTISEAVAYGHHWEGMTERVVEYKDNLTYAYLKFSEIFYAKELKIILSKDNYYESYETTQKLIYSYSKTYYNKKFDVIKDDLDEYTFIPNASWNFKTFNRNPVINQN